MAKTDEPRYVESNWENTPYGKTPRNVLRIDYDVSIILDSGKSAVPRYTYATMPTQLIWNERVNIDFIVLATSMWAWYEQDWRVSDKWSKKSLSVTRGDARKILKDSISNQWETLSALLQQKIKVTLKEITWFEVDETTAQNGLDQVFFSEWLRDITFVDQLNAQLQVIGFQYDLGSRMLSELEN